MSKIDAVFKKNNFTGLDFDSSRLIIQHHSTSVLPTIGTEQELIKLAQIELPINDESNTWKVEKIQNTNLSVTTFLNTLLVQHLEKKIPNVDIHLVASSFIEESSKLSKFSEKHQLNWLISKTTSYMCIHKKGELLIFNQFETSNTEDLLYYTLNTLELIDIDPTTCQINITGNIRNIQLNEDILSDYLHDFKIISDIQGLQANLISDIAITRNYTMLNQFLCG